jgi:hypothetical protein
LMPELKAQQLELGTAVCRSLDDVGAELRHWRRRADAAASAVGARVWPPRRSWSNRCRRRERGTPACSTPSV